MKPTSNHLILIGILAGAACGLFFGEKASILEPFAMAFIKIMQISVLPFLVASIISGVSNLKVTEAGKIALKGGLVVISFWVVSIVAILFIARSFPQMHTGSFFSTRFLEDQKPIDFMEILIPYNPFHSLAEGYFPAIVIFCFIMGFALIGDEKNKPFREMLKGLPDIFLRITNYLKLIIPLGSFAIFAVAAGTLKQSDVLEMQIFLISTIAYCLLMAFLVLPLMIYSITPFGYRDIFSCVSKSLLLSFSSGNSFIALPQVHQGILDQFNKYGSDKCGSDKCGSQDRVKIDTNFLLPLGVSIPLCASFTTSIFILFASWYYDNSQLIINQLEIVTVSIPWLFGSATLAAQSLLNIFHLPDDAIELFVGAHGLYINFSAVLSTMALFSYCVISISQLTGIAEIRWRKAIMSLLIIILIFALVVTGMSIGFSNLVNITHPQGNVLSKMELPASLSNSTQNGNLKISVIPDQNDSMQRYGAKRPNLGEKIDPNVLERIKNRKVLRVGYNASNLPFCFFNIKGDLVGYDVQMAYELAQFLDISQVEFVPIKEEKLNTYLNDGYCDIIMSRIWITRQLLDDMDFTSPYIKVHMSVVVPDWRKEEFENLDEIQVMKNLSIAVTDEAKGFEMAQKIFPSANIVKIGSYEEFFTGNKADALFISAEAGYPLTLLYPKYDVVIFKPADVYKSSYAYPIALNNESFLKMLNYWINMENEYGGLSAKYDHWVLGKSAAAQEPRWCIAKDVLHLAI